MDAYPGDLLTGVFPLVFAVDAILPTLSNADKSLIDDGPVDAPQPAPLQRTSSTRSLFDRFLDAMASHLSDNNGISSIQSPRRTGTDTFSSLLRGDDIFGSGEVSSDDEDDSLDSSTGRRFRGIGTPSIVPGLNPARSLKTPISVSTSFAKSLKVDGFFERARILSISNRHGFPPSKDSTGQMNRTLKLSQARSALSMNPTDANALRLKRVLDTNPIEGILNAGWLEKHAAALPSVLLIVTSFQVYDKAVQDEQDAHLLETVEHLRESMASKRECSLRLVCLADTPDHPTTPGQVDEWISRMKRDCELTTADVTMLQIPHDLESAPLRALNSSIAVGPMQKLHREVRDASWTYYQTLCRRVKRKLNQLSHDNQPILLPLAVRYCFKIGVFYEFLLVHTKALKYFYKAYRLLQTYYLHLLGKSIVWNNATPSSGVTRINPQSDEIGGVELSLESNRYSVSDENGATSGVEVSLADDSFDEDDEEDMDNRQERTHTLKPRLSSTGPLDIRKIFTEINPPFDMANQCRQIADWLNFKLLQAGLQSSSYSDSDQGIVAAAAQWQRHCQVFLKHDDVNNPVWGYWSYASRQRLVMSQLVERFPPRKASLLPQSIRDEVLMKCSPWRNYMAAAEANLRLGVEVRKSAVDIDAYSTAPLSKTNLRGRFVGSMDSEGLGPLLHDEAKRDHIEIALGMLSRAVALYESEIEHARANHDAENSIPFVQESAHRAGARIFYLYGGVLLGKKRYKEAIVFLEKAVKHAKGWKGLELVIRRMLMECYEKYLPTQTTTSDEQTAMIASMILDSYFNSKMSSRNLRRALTSFSSISGGGVMKWHRECIDEASSSLPFSFAVTFPKSTHATAGEEVTANVMVQSNLDYAVHINKLTLISMAGEIQVPSNFLLSAENACEGSSGGIIIQAKACILLTTPIALPSDIGSIAIDEAGNGGEARGTAGKGSFAKSARPRTAGFTSGAGARLISEKRFQKDPQHRDSQWSVRYLGGRPMRCDGIRLLFYPVHVEKASISGTASQVNIIELTIKKKRPSTSADFKRTPFEEDNYLSSAWSRPNNLPLSRGPRCLRVLGPMPEMIVTNLSEEVSGSKVIEGTVNRILLKLQAGANEICDNIKFKIECSSMLLSIDGTTVHLKTEASNNIEQNVGNDFRIPGLVTEDEIVAKPCVSHLGYTIPRGWKLIGSGTRTGMTEPLVSKLNPGEETFIFFDVYRPHGILDAADEKASLHNQQSLGGGNSLCQTDFDVSIQYTQARPKVQRIPGRRRRKPASDNTSPEEDSNESHFVSLEYTGSVTWTAPISAAFSSVGSSQKAPPAGSRHHSNLIPDDAKSTHTPDSLALEEEDPALAVIDGEIVSTRCALWAQEMPSDCGIMVSRVWYESSVSTNSPAIAPCNFSLVGSPEKPASLFEATENDVGHHLQKGKKLGVLLTVECSLTSGFECDPLSANMGVVCVDWAPNPVPVPPDMKSVANVEYHGPLQLLDKSTMRFHGPLCYIERAPFCLSVSVHPPSPRVGTPFNLVVSILNQSKVHQVVSVSLQDAPENVDILVAGSTKGDLRLSPNATQLLAYTMIATKAGKVSIPPIFIGSSRYKTWLIKGSGPSTELFILP